MKSKTTRTCALCKEAPKYTVSVSGQFVGFCKPHYDEWWSVRDLCVKEALEEYLKTGSSKR